MKKEELKTLIDQMHHDLLQHIESDKELDKNEVTQYLKNILHTIELINDGTDSLSQTQQALSDACKNIVIKSLTSYKKTNENFKEISKLQADTVDECTDYLIETPEIINKFNDIQTYMLDEIEKANETIMMLTKQVKDLEETSNLDALTKLFNRRALDSYLESVTSKKTLQHELHLLILDIDDFKKINDIYGHIVGDKVLIFLANMLRKTLRDGDKVFRYGGEEFVIILNRITAEKCREIAQRILHNISSNRLLYKGKSVNITVSIGATKYIPGDTPESIIERADKALYRSKENGKNQMSVEAENGH
ncbi:GGDEF domain-containing protein [Sulfurimonas paralvinellae]|uniref:diguanylate cyclase n=1 Tax=Sulfurimonas paralvinellae TaxID=317658 RepID=A0A7M1BB26_9BACT|nr:GGDEF domain-containing protein [Sulfurimonas paralvinellae]QOP45972.1 GGDEF domain-containing protein [Sulfurimonas paralvinellae]